MRQAGRYMAAFREYSDKYPFRMRSETPEIAIELSLQVRGAAAGGARCCQSRSLGRGRPPHGASSVRRRAGGRALAAWPQRRAPAARAPARTRAAAAAPDPRCPAAANPRASPAP